MVRGIQKQIIHLKNPESALFEEAFLIMKTGARQNVPTLTMVEEANRLLETLAPTPIQEEDPPTTGGLRSLLLFFCGTLLGVFATLLFLL